MTYNYVVLRRRSIYYTRVSAKITLARHLKYFSSYWYVKNMLFQIFCFFKKCTYIGTLNLAKTRKRKPIIIIIMVCVISELEGKASNYSSKPKNGIFYATFPQAANWWRAPPPPPPSSWRRLGTTISTTVCIYYAAAYPNDICSPCKALTSSGSGSAL